VVSLRVCAGGQARHGACTGTALGLPCTAQQVRKGGEPSVSPEPRAQNPEPRTQKGRGPRGAACPSAPEPPEPRTQNRENQWCPIRVPLGTAGPQQLLQGARVHACARGQLAPLCPHTALTLLRAMVRQVTRPSHLQPSGRAGGRAQLCPTGSWPSSGPGRPPPRQPPAAVERAAPQGCEPCTG